MSPRRYWCPNKDCHGKAVTYEGNYGHPRADGTLERYPTWFCSNCHKTLTRKQLEKLQSVWKANSCKSKL